MLTYEIGENKQGKLNAEDSYAVFSYKGFETKLSITPFVKKMNIHILRSADQTNLLNEYIYKAGIEGEMNKVYSSVSSYLSVDNFDPTADTSNSTIKRTVSKFCHDMLDLFDLDKMQEFLVERGVETPKTLKDSFDKSVEIDLIVTRDQTYIRSEYYGLLALALVIKTVAPIIGEVYCTNKQVILSDNENLSFLQFVIGHKIIESEQAKRLIRYINKHIELKTKSADGMALNIVAIRMKVTEDTLWELVLANSFFKKFAMAPIGIQPPLTGDVASAVYSIIKNMTKDNVSVSNRVSVKESSRPGDGDDSGSVIEGYTQTTEISLGELAEFNFSTNDVEKMYLALGGKDMSLLHDFHKAAGSLYIRVDPLCKGSVLLSSYVLHRKVIDARAILHLDYTNVVNVMVVAAAHCYERGDKEIANAILLKKSNSRTLVSALSSRTAPENLRTSISAKYVKSIVKPKKSRMNMDKIHPVNDLITPFVNTFDKHFLDGSREYVLPKRYRPDTLPNEDGNIFSVPSDFKTYLINFLEANLKE